MNLITRTQSLTIRLPYETVEEIKKYSEFLRLKPTRLCSMVLQDSLKDWVKNYAKEIYEGVEELV